MNWIETASLLIGVIAALVLITCIDLNINPKPQVDTLEEALAYSLALIRGMVPASCNVKIVIHASEGVDIEIAPGKHVFLVGIDSNSPGDTLDAT